MIPFHVWVKLHRKYVGIDSVSKLDRLADLSPGSVSYLEKHGKQITIATAAKLCGAMGLEMWEAFFFMEKCDAGNYQPDEV